MRHYLKPWRVSSNEERLNPFNGLLLIPNLDAAFDQGLISFKDSGRIVISSRLDARTISILGIDPETRLRKIAKEHFRYLAYHREEIFQ